MFSNCKKEVMVMCTENGYDPEISRKKGATEGGIAGFVTLLTMSVVSAIRQQFEVPWDVEVDVAFVTGIVTLVTGVTKWWRNRSKHVED